MECFYSDLAPFSKYWRPKFRACVIVRFMFLENMEKIILVFFKNCYFYLTLAFFMFFIFF